MADRGRRPTGKVEERPDRRAARPRRDVIHPTSPRSTRRREVDTSLERNDDFTLAGYEVSLQLPGPLKRGWQRRRQSWTQVDSAAAWMTAGHLLLLLVLISPGSFYLDDLRAQGYAQGQSFLPFIFGSNETHFAPIPRILDWVQASQFPLQHWPAVIITMGVRLLLAVAFYRLLRRTFGPRLGILVPFGILLVTPALLPATLWYRQAITVVASTVAMVWALDAHLRWVVQRQRRDLLSVPLLTALGVCCYEKSAAIPVILFGASLAIFARPRRRGPATRWLGAAAASVALSGAVIVVFLVIYKTGPYDQAPGKPPTPLDVLHLTWDTLTRDVVPLLLGGPWHWFYESAYLGTPHPSDTTVGVVIGVLALGALYAARKPGKLLRSLVFGACWVIPSVTVVAVGRWSQLGLLISDAARLWADLVPACLFTAALALLPWQVGALAGVSERAKRRVPISLIRNERPEPRPRPAPAPAPVVDGTGNGHSPAAATTRPVTNGFDFSQELADERARATAAAEAGPPEPRPVEPPAPAPVQPEPADEPTSRGTLELSLGGALTALVLVAALIGTSISTWTFADNWWKNPTGKYLDQMRASLALAEPYPRVLATPFPLTIFPGFVTAEFPTTAPLVLLLRPDARFQDADGQVRGFNALGALTQPIPKVIGGTKPAKGCAAGIQPGQTEPVRVPLQRPVGFVPSAQIDVGLLLDETTKVEVTVETLDGKVVPVERWSDDELPKGPHTLRFPVPFGASIQAVRVQTDARSFDCVNDVQFWVPTL